MPRSLPTNIKQDLHKRYSGGAWLPLCEIAFPSQNTQFLARNTENVTYAGQVYDKANMRIGDQVWSSDGSIPRVTIQVAQDVDKELENIINQAQGVSGATVKLIRVGENFLDVAVPALEADYNIIATDSDHEWVTIILGIPNPLLQRIPLDIYTQDKCPESIPARFKGSRCKYAGPDPTCTGLLSDCISKSNETNFGGDMGLDPNGAQF